jgi:hypothetical protein
MVGLTKSLFVICTVVISHDQSVSILYFSLVATTHWAIIDYDLNRWAVLTLVIMATETIKYFGGVEGYVRFVTIYLFAFITLYVFFNAIQ